jgi:carbonic anhydrase
VTTKATIGFIVLMLAALPAGAKEPAAGSPTPAEALKRLTDGNARFTSGKVAHQHQDAAWRAGLTKGQQPFAVILGCSDSRVPAEMVFDEGFGQLFVVRVAGNFAADDERGSIEYAVVHLHAPLVLVLGHEQCGAVTAALASEADRKGEPEAIQKLVGQIEPGLRSLPADTKDADRLGRAIDVNVRRSVQEIRAIPGFEDRIKRGELNVVGAVYELGTGHVRLLGDEK